MRLPECLSAYLADCQVGLSPLTSSLYARNIQPLVEWLLANDVLCLDQLSTAHLRAYFANLQATQHGPRGQPYSQNTIHQRFRSIRTWLNWCVAQSLLARNPIDAMRTPELPSPVARFLSLPFMAQLLEAVGETASPARNQAIVQLFMDTGIRRQELANLEVADVDLTAHQLTVRRGKGGRGRVLPISSQAVTALSAWLVLRPAKLTTLFGLKAHGVYLLLRRLGRKLGMPNLSPHKLRHSFGTYYEGDIYDLAKILGHRDIKVTAEVYRHKDVARLVVVHDDRSPLGQVLNRTT
jgi:site-specific recombinase XerC